MGHLPHGKFSVSYVGFVVSQCAVGCFSLVTSHSKCLAMYKTLQGSQQSVAEENGRFSDLTEHVSSAHRKTFALPRNSFAMKGRWHWSRIPVGPEACLKPGLYGQYQHKGQSLSRWFPHVSFRHLPLCHLKACLEAKVACMVLVEAGI